MKHSFAILGLSALLLSCGGQDKNTQEITYQTLVVDTASCTLQSNYTASIVGKQSVEIRPQVSGTITQIRINEGDAVKKGQTLFVIDQVPYIAALETAKANVKTAEAKLATAKLTAESKEMLFKEKVVSEYDLQTARNAKLEAEAALAQAKAEVVRTRNELSYTEVKSPVDGVASMIPYRVGALVDSNISDPLVTVSDDSEVYAYFSMAENQVIDLLQQYGSLENAIQKIPEVTLTMSNGNTYPHKGKIDAISGTIEKTTGTVSLRAVFANSERLLRDGGSGKVQIPYYCRNAIIIPQEATYEIQDKTFVYKVVNGCTKSTNITVNPMNNGTEYIVESGLQKGDTIIAAGAGLLKDGIRIQTSEK